MTAPQAPSLEQLLGGGGKAAKFVNIGDTKGGEIVNISVSQQTKFPSGELMTNPKTGQPLWQILVSVKTNERDPEEPTDDGVRTLYVKGNMLFAVSKALREHGLKEPELGGTLVVRLVELEDTGKGNPLKKYTAAYKPAPAAGLADAFAGVQQAQPQYQQPVQQAPVQQAPVQQAPVQQAPVQQAPVQQPVAQPQASGPSSQEADLLAMLNAATQ